MCNHFWVYRGRERTGVAGCLPAVVVKLPSGRDRWFQWLGGCWFVSFSWGDTHTHRDVHTCDKDVVVAIILLLRLLLLKSVYACVCNSRPTGSFFFSSLRLRSRCIWTRTDESLANLCVCEIVPSRRLQSQTVGNCSRKGSD